MSNAAATPSAELRQTLQQYDLQQYAAALVALGVASPPNLLDLEAAEVASLQLAPLEGRRFQKLCEVLREGADL